MKSSAKTGLMIAGVAAALGGAYYWFVKKNLSGKPATATAQASATMPAQPGQPGALPTVTPPDLSTLASQAQAALNQLVAPWQAPTQKPADTVTMIKPS